MRLVFTLILTGVAVAGAILGYRALAGNDGQKASSQGVSGDAVEAPISTVPGAQDGEPGWTADKLKAAKPLDLPSPAAPADLSGAGETAAPSQSGAGSAGGPEAEATDDATLIPGLPDPEDTTGSKQD